MSNPLFPFSHSSGAQEAWEDAVWMDDCDRLENKRKVNKQEPGVSRQPVQQVSQVNSGAQTSNLKTFLVGLIAFVIIIMIILSL